MALGDYDVINGLAMVGDDFVGDDFVDPDMVAAEGTEAFGAFELYAPEDPGVTSMQGLAADFNPCYMDPPGPDCVLSGLGETYKGDCIEACKGDEDCEYKCRMGLNGLGDAGLVQVIEGLSDFASLGDAETKAYHQDEDLSAAGSEGYPLGADLGDGITSDEMLLDDSQLDTEDTFDLPESGFSPEDMTGGGGYDDTTPAEGDDNSDIPKADTPDQAELASILVARRQAIVDAIKQRDLQTAKVADLDHQIVDILNPAYQTALAKNNRTAAAQLGVKIRILNLQRAEAAAKAIDWAKFQATVAQMAKNAGAQLALAKLYQETLQSDPNTAAQVAQAYQEIGAVTQAIKDARARAVAAQQAQAIRLMAGKLADLNANIARRRQMLASSNVRPEKRTMLQQNIDLLEKQAIPLRQQLRAANQSVMMPPTTESLLLPSMGGGALPASVMDPSAQLAGFDEVVPFCEVYGRDSYGPTCLRQGKMDLGGLDGLGDFWHTTADILTGGAAEQSWDKKQQGEVQKEVGKVQKASDFMAKNVTCPVANKLNSGAVGDVAKSAGGILGKFMVGGIVNLCSGGHAPPAPVYTPPLPPPWYKRPGPMLALALVVGGAVGGIALAMRPPERMNGLGRLHARRRRHGRR